MGYTERKQLFDKIVLKRQRPLLTYVTSIRPGMGCQMAGDSIRPIIDQLEQIPKEEKNIDFLIISNGGDPITSLRIMGLLRERFEKVSILLPYVAYSAATILSLGADELVMHPYSNIGPVDPQLSAPHRMPSGATEQLEFSPEDIVNYIEFLKTDVKADKEQMKTAIPPLMEQVGALNIGRSKRSQRLSFSLSEKMLGFHIRNNKKIKEIAKALNSSYYHHGYAVGRLEAQKMGLPITIPDVELEGLLWKVWLDYEAEMKCNEPFNVVNEVLANPNASKAINSFPIINLPANLPDSQKQAIYNQIASQVNVIQQQTLSVKCMLASIESPFAAKVFYNDITIAYWRDANLNLKVNLTPKGSGWIKY